jgi:hypothetical protein
MAPPEIIVLHRIAALLSAVNKDPGRVLKLVPPAPVKAIPGHDPSHKKPMFFKRVCAVLRARGNHGALAPVNGRNPISVKGEKHGGKTGSLILGMICNAGLLARALHGTILCCSNGRQNQKKEEEQHAAKSFHGRS